MKNVNFLIHMDVEGLDADFETIKCRKRKCKYIWKVKNQSGVAPNWVWKITQTSQLKRWGILIKLGGMFLIYWIFTLLWNTFQSTFQFKGGKLQHWGLATPLWFWALYIIQFFVIRFTMHMTDSLPQTDELQKHHKKVIPCQNFDSQTESVNST